MKITYYNGSTDAYSGQVNMEAAIYVNGEIVGAVEYVLYNRELTISDIQIKPEWRRKGMGSRLMKYIKQENPEYTYKPSMKTIDGASFIQKDFPLDENMIAKKVYETINEKFSETSDPIDDMGIGALNKKVNFSNKEEVTDFIIGMIPSILNTDKIPKDIINQQGVWINVKYYGTIVSYVKKYITINEVEFTCGTVENLLVVKKLYDMGFKMPSINIERLKTSMFK